MMGNALNLYRSFDAVDSLFDVAREKKMVKKNHCTQLLDNEPAKIVKRPERIQIRLNGIITNNHRTNHVQQSTEKKYGHTIRTINSFFLISGIR